MDVRIVESMATSGALADPTFRIDGNIENVSLDWDNTDRRLSLVDYNMNYSILPWQLYDDVVKKVFLTYNGLDCTRRNLLETVVMESDDASDLNQIPGYNNSNEWQYSPSTFQYPTELQNFTDVSQFSSMPYNYGAGFTVVKEFLTAGANISPNLGAYTAYYRAPQMTNFVPPNVESNKIYTDGWYTSYVCLVRTWLSLDPPTNGASTGDIVYYEQKEKFYINTTGVGGVLIQDPDYPNDPTRLIPDPTDWTPDPSFAQWQELMRNNVGPSMVDDPIYFVETQHLVTVELNEAILYELKRICNCCDNPKFGASHIDLYQKLYHKRLGAWVQFNQELFHQASCTLINARPLCHQCLYHQGESLNIGRGTC